MSKHEDFIYFLLDRGCSVRDSNIYGEQSWEETPDSSNQAPEVEQTVLGAAIPEDSYEMVSRLITEGGEVHAQQRWRDPTDRIRDGKGVTALHIGSLFWNLEGIHALVNHRGDVSVAEMAANADDHGRLPLHWALLGERNERDRRTRESNQDEIPSRMMKTVKLLLGANPHTINARDQQGATVFNYAVKSDTGISNILSIVKILLNAKPLASTLNYRDPVGATALQDAVDHHYRRCGNLNEGQLMGLLEIFLTNGADARLCLHRLCDGQWMESISPVMIDRLLEVSDINDTDADGCTAMHYLVRHLDQIDAARHLISRGADVKVVNHKGNTPLHEVMKGTLLRRLNENGIPNPSQPRDGPTRAREELIKVLVDAGSSMDQPNTARQTPLQLLDELTERRRQVAAGQHGLQGQGRDGT